MDKEKKRKTVKRNKSQGRKVQRQFARRLGGKSVGTIEGQDISFSESSPFHNLSVEVKHRKTFVGISFMQQAIRNAPEGKLPVVIVHGLRQKWEESLIIFRIKDWEELYVKGKKEKKKALK